METVSPTSSKAERRKYLLLWLSALTLNALALSPLLQSGFMGDDFHHSYMRGIVQLSQQSLLETNYQVIWGWIHQLYRFFPLQSYFIYLFYYVPDVLLYKTIVLALITLDLVLFGRLIAILTQSRWLALLAVAVMPIFFQFRIFHDPILGFFGFLQILAIFLFGSMILFLKYLYSGKKLPYLLSISLYFLGLLSYEIFYTFCLFYFAIAYCFSPKKGFCSKIKAAWPFFVLALIFFLLTVLIRLHYNVPTNVRDNNLAIAIANAPGTDPKTFMAYVPNFSPAIILKTFIKQLFAALPLSYFVMNLGSFFPRSVEYLTPLAGGRFLAIFFGSATIVFLAFKGLRRESPDPKSRPLLYFGSLLVALPPLLVSFVPRYQEEIVWGVSYLPVYLSYFGFAMGIAALAWSLRQIAKTAFLAIAAILACIACLNTHNNQQVVKAMNRAWFHPRSLIEEAMQHGAFKFLPFGSAYLISENSAPWEEPAFFFMHSRRKFQYVGTKGHYFSDQSGGKKHPIREYQSPRDWAYLRYESDSKDNGHVVVGEIRSLRFSNEEIYSATSSRINLYVRTPITHDGTVLLDGKWAGVDEKDAPFTLQEQDISLISSGPGWKLFSIITDGKLAELKSLKARVIESTRGATAKK